MQHVETKTAVSRQRARELLRVGPRRLQQLVNCGSLQKIGRGHGAKISTESLEQVLAERNNETVLVIKANGSNEKRNDKKPFRNFDSECIYKQTNQPDDHSMVVRYTNSPELGELELLSLDRSAGLLGISVDALKKLVDSGELTVVQIGSRTRISASVLRSFAQGRPMGRVELL